MYEENAHGVNIDVDTYTQLVIESQKYHMVVNEFFRDCNRINGHLYPSASLETVFRMVEPVRYDNRLEDLEEQDNG